MDNLLENLNKEQHEAVCHISGPLLIVAGAGTGKTTVITRRIAYLIQQGLAKPDEILALTFTDKAAGEMEARVEELLPLGNYDLWISTFHSFCQRILEQRGADIGLSPGFKLLDEVQQWILIFKNFEKFNLDYYRPLGSPNKFIEALRNHFSKCKDEMILPEKYLEYAEKLKLDTDTPATLIPLSSVAEDLASTLVNSEKFIEISRTEEVANAFHIYQKLLLDNEYLDFGDLINYAIELFRKRPKILAYFQKKFKFILVDEFQDTNFAQYQLVKMLSGQNNKPASSRPERNAGSQANLVVVGDDDQSIYKFRGASVSNILKLKEDYPDLKQITLVQNYRSAQNILNLAYNFIQANNPNRLEFKLGISKNLISNAKEEGIIQVLEGRDLSKELDLVARKIVEIKNSDPACTWNDFAILLRANSAAEEIIPRLDNAGITYTFLANRGLYRKQIVYDLINYLRLLDNLHEAPALYRVLNFPKFSISPNELALITNYASKKALSLFEALRLARTIPGVTEQSVKKIESLLGIIKMHCEEVKTRTAVEIFVQIVKDLGLRESLEADTLKNAEDREYLEQFYKSMEVFEEQAEDKSLKNFIYNLELEMRAGSEGSIKFDPNLGPESLKVMTLHSSKGLEFKYVFIPNLVEQRFPTRAKRDVIEIPEALIKDILPEGDFHLQEERRLFYVGVTRAKRRLYLSWGRDYGGAKLKRPSQFLRETGLVPSEKVAKATGKVVFEKKISASKAQVYHNLPGTFSFTDIAMFENCPMEFKFRKYLRLPMPGTASLSFGKTIHTALEKFAESYKKNLDFNQQALFGKAKEVALPNFKLMESLYTQHWVDEWYKNTNEKEDYRKEGLKMLKVVYEDFAARKPLILFIEQPFVIPLGNYTFKGKIDRIDSENNAVTIIDYKTGATKAKTKRDVDQLRIYQWATQAQLKQKVGSLCFWYLKEDKKIIQPTATAEEIENLKKSLLESIDEIIQTIKFDLFLEKHRKLKGHYCNFAN